MKEETMSTVRTEQIGGVLLIEINNPPINAGSLAVRQGLTAALQRAVRRRQDVATGDVDLVFQREGDGLARDGHLHLTVETDDLLHP